MPAAPSSLLARIAERLGHHDQLTTAEMEKGLPAHLATVPDPRDRRGVRHRLASLLSVAVCAVLAGRSPWPRSGNGPPTPPRRC